LSNAGAADRACRRCGGQVVRKPATRLVIVGVVMLESVGLALVWPILWAPCLILAMTGIYLMVWASLGGKWCRACKRFDGV
jgi:hypothetical protein